MEKNNFNDPIDLDASPTETTERVMQISSDPARPNRSAPGNPELCSVFSLHKEYSEPDAAASIELACRQAGIGCVACKQMLARNINASLFVFRLHRVEQDHAPSQK